MDQAEFKQLSLFSWIQVRIRTVIAIFFVIWTLFGVSFFIFLKTYDRNTWSSKASEWLEQASFHVETASIRQLEHSSTHFLEDYPNSILVIEEKSKNQTVWQFPSSVSGAITSSFSGLQSRSETGAYRIRLSTPSISVYERTIGFVLAYILSTIALVVSVVYSLKTSARLISEEAKNLRRPDTLSVFHELHDMKSAIETMRGEKENLRVDAEIGRAHSQIAHDLRGPTTALSMISKSSRIDADEREILDLAIGRIRSITGTLLADRKQSNLECRIRFLQSSLRIEAKALKKTPNISIELSALSAAPDNLQEEVLTHLLNLGYNALESVDSCGYVNIFSNLKENRLFFTVEDSGGGVPKSVLDSLLKSGSANSTKKNGNGIALASLNNWLNTKSSTFTSTRRMRADSTRSHRLEFSIDMNQCG